MSVVFSAHCYFLFGLHSKINTIIPFELFLHGFCCFLKIHLKLCVFYAKAPFTADLLSITNTGDCRDK